MPHTNVVLSLSCRDQPGIVAAVAKTLFDAGCNVVEAHQFNDAETNLFFMRTRFAILKPGGSIEALKAEFEAVANDLGLTWTMRSLKEKQRVMILVSKFDHCLADLLYRWRTGEIDMDIVGIIANHPRETYAHLDLDGIPFHYLPVTKATKMEQEAQVWELIRAANTDLVVLARYMQVLSDGLCAKLAGRCINIHHSFLPGFKGARPYHQAFARGVKLIGATAHYVTPDLDEGPIIEQDVERISHHNTVEDLVRKGREIERRVLARAITWHLDGRVIMNGSKTVVFKD
ncbi:formyltetrahydrofolate deformylase [Rhodopseudomonas palustris]|uniref:formyltetrahydrofolate deformylase n=1 Tax=Rhodopseudomonas TaxID=1073 RepID=UPI0006B9FBAF|nr:MULTISPECIES: formyltetrahydrofolate deformylase [Rhodopseudomonas]KPG01482.1 formyltetrahydrofolate deformylase [Rhodopseudomonas sp. AAP120]MCP9627436.1 formyltetrahydrofolate deformylase [Rhodopseudomonas palustris]